MMYWWLCIKEEAEHAKDVQRRFRDQIHRGSPLPPKYDRALASLELVLVNMMNIRGSFASTIIQQRPGFADHFQFHTIKGGLKVQRRDHLKSFKDALREDPLLWCLINLCGKPDAATGTSHDRLFRFLEEHLAVSSIKEKARIDQVVYDQMSDHAANHQLLLAVRLHRPQNKAGDSEVFYKTEDRRAWQKSIIVADENGPRERGLLLKRYYEVSPPGVKRDLTWIEQDEKAETAMRAYWSALRRVTQRRVKDEDFLAYLEADLDPSHLEAVEARRQAVRDGVAQRSIISKQASIVLPVMEEKTKLDTLPVRSKPKTRPSPSDDNTNSQDDQQTEAPTAEAGSAPSSGATPVTTSSVTKRAADIFARMFAQDVDSAGKGSDWDQFVYAMKDIGFSARNSAGSAVVFELPEKGRIVFHKPHPEARIDAVLLKAMGKRMMKWFGGYLEGVGLVRTWC